MKIIYQAFDGKNFDNEEKCEIYEFKNLHPNLFSINFYDEDNRLFRLSKDEDKLWNDETYYKTEKVEIHNTAELSDFLLLAKECGWCEFYEQIDDVGLWTRTEDEMRNGVWVKFF